MKLPKDFDAGLIPRHVGPDTLIPLELRLYHGHMHLVATLMSVQTQLHESGYKTAVRESLVGPAHTAVMRSARALAKAAASAAQEKTP